MIKTKFYIILFTFSLAFPQTSSVSFYGQGEYLNSFNASSIGLGNSKYFGENSSGFSVSFTFAIIIGISMSTGHIYLHNPHEIHKCEISNFKNAISKNCSL